MKETLSLVASSIISCLLILNLHSVVSAASSKPSPSPSVSPSPSPLATPTENEIAESLKERLKDSLTASPSALPKSEYRALIGVIKDVIQKTLIVETKDGKKQVTIGDDATIVRSPGNATIKQDSVRIDDYVIAMGTIKEDDVLSGRRVIVSTSPLTTTQKKTGYGQVTDIKGKVLTLSFEDQEIALTSDADTIIKSKDSSSLSLTDIPMNSRIIYTAEVSKDTTLATTIMLIK